MSKFIHQNHFEKKEQEDIPLAFEPEWSTVQKSTMYRFEEGFLELIAPSVHTTIQEPSPPSEGKNLSEQRATPIAQSPIVASEDVNDRPLFTQKDLNRVRTRAFQEGKAEGIKEAGHTTPTFNQTQPDLEILDQGKISANLLQTLHQQLQNLVAPNVIETHDLEIASTALSIQGLKYLFPKLSQACGFDELLAFLQKKLNELDQQPCAILIKLSPKDKLQIELALQEILEESPLKSNWKIIEDASLAQGDGIVIWDQGYYERNQKQAFDVLIHKLSDLVHLPIDTLENN